jgi:hypothetical protein
LLVAGCGASSGTPSADAGAACLCGATGLDVQVDFSTSDEFCPVTELGLTVTFPGGSALTNDIRCSDPAPLSQGARLVVPWPAGVQAGESGTIAVILTGDGGTVANGFANVIAAPDTCTVVAIHATCDTGLFDGGPLPGDASPGLAAR